MIVFSNLFFREDVGSFRNGFCEVGVKFRDLDLLVFVFFIGVELSSCSTEGQPGTCALGLFEHGFE